MSKIGQRRLPPRPLYDRLELLRRIEPYYQRCYDEHRLEIERIGNRHPVGGSHMDSFFRAEALRGLQRALRLGWSLSIAIDRGQEESAESVRVWNAKRGKDYQTHRWEQTAWGYLDWIVKRCLADP